jgi:hypothetical protein
LTRTANATERQLCWRNGLWGSLLSYSSVDSPL